MDEVIVARLTTLTDLQRRILRLTASGATAAEVAARLDLPPTTIDQELTTVLVALGVRSQAEASLLWWGSRAGARPELALAALGLVI